MVGKDLKQTRFNSNSFEFLHNQTQLLTNGAISLSVNKGGGGHVGS